MSATKQAVNKRNILSPLTTFLIIASSHPETSVFEGCGRGCLGGGRG